MLQEFKYKFGTMTGKAFFYPFDRGLHFQQLNWSNRSLTGWRTLSIGILLSQFKVDSSSAPHDPYIQSIVQCEEKQSAEVLMKNETADSKRLLRLMLIVTPASTAET